MDAAFRSAAFYRAVMAQHVALSGGSHSAMMELDPIVPIQLPAGAVMSLDDGPELPPLPPMDDGDEPLIPELHGLD